MKLRTMHKRAKRKLKNARKPFLIGLDKFIGRMSISSGKYLSVRGSFTFYPNRPQFGKIPENLPVRNNWTDEREINIDTELKVDDPLFVMMMRAHMKGIRSFSEPTDKPGIFKHSFFPGGKDYETLDAELLE